MENVIKLDIKKSVTKLAGYTLGEQLYNNQVKDRISFDKEIVIEFPENIQDLASSFVQGFFYEFVEKIGIKGIDRQVNIISSKQDMKEQIIKNLI